MVRQCVSNCPMVGQWMSNCPIIGQCIFNCLKVWQRRSNCPIVGQCMSSCPMILQCMSNCPMIGQQENHCKICAFRRTILVWPSHAFGQLQTFLTPANERPRSDHVTSVPMTGLKKLHLMAQTDGHGDSMTLWLYDSVKIHLPSYIKVHLIM